ncbi:hypothetical protein [Blastomonas sp.]|uniref:hypothetical protein n=1 Tax=Blastomonas sp. TaxID=1909299 RepID=UPI00406A77FD
MSSHNFAHQHGELLVQADAILTAVTVGTEAAMRDLPARRLAFSRLVNSHCSVEIRLVNTRTPLFDQDPKNRQLIRRFHDELLMWRGDLMDCNANWPQRRVAEDSAGFLAVFRGLTDRLKGRVRWEEEIFYPAIMGIPARR